MEDECVPVVASDPKDDALLAARVSRLIGIAADLTTLAAAAEVLRRREIDLPLITDRRPSTGLPVGTERWWCRALDERAAPDRGLTGLRVVGATDAVSVIPVKTDYVRTTCKHRSGPEDCAAQDGDCQKAPVAKGGCNRR
jgi:hypothetical protein